MFYALYIASVVGAISLLLMMPRAGFNPRKIGAVLGAATLGGLWLFLARFLPEHLGIAKPAMIYYYVFSAIAIASAVRVITHAKPVFSALWFVLLVCATAGLFLLLSAEFMAFAMLIIYGGAILVTYVFVIMLASRSSDVNDLEEYDRVAAEPTAAIAAGFLLLAVLLTVMFRPGPIENPAARGPTQDQILASVLTNRSEDRGAAAAAGDPGLQALVERDDRVGKLSNVEQVGLDLFRSHPLGLELAGVILLVSLVGAVVIARKRVGVPEGTQGMGPIVGPTEARGREPGPKDVETIQSIQGAGGAAGAVGGASGGGVP